VQLPKAVKLTIPALIAQFAEVVESTLIATVPPSAVALGV
jgi:hypothetical protein